MSLEQRQASHVLQQLSTGAPQDDLNEEYFPYDFRRVKGALDQKPVEVQRIGYKAVVAELLEALRKKRAKVDIPDLMHMPLDEQVLLLAEVFRNRGLRLLAGRILKRASYRCFTLTAF